jgi:putative DNA primase/helicase
VITTDLSAASLSYLDDHAIDPDVAAAIGVTGTGSEITYPYIASDGTEFVRRRNLNQARTLQPVGQGLELWRPVPIVTGNTLIVCEGEPDCLAAISALYEVEGGELVRRRDLPPPLQGLVPIAVPGVGACHAQLAKLKTEAWVIFDGDDAGRTSAKKLADRLQAASTPVHIIDLPDGRDLADLLHATSEPAEWLAEAIADVDALDLTGPSTGSTEAVAASEPVPAPPKFIAKRLAERLMSETPVAANASGQLYVFRNGAYRPGGNADLEKRIAHHLGDDWRKQRAAEVIGYLGAVAERLWPEPPRDRVNCLNGIVGLDGRLEAHSPTFLSPIQINAAFDPAAECPAIDKFLGEVLAPDLGELIYELVGYLVVPDQSLQMAMMFLGEGANGKSTLLNLITDLLGRRNVSSVALHRLDEDRFSVAELEGKLANVFADLDARALNASSMFKSITGGDAVTGERKYANAFQFTPYARLLFSANEPPPTPDSSDAFYRRWAIVPFERRFDPGKADRQLGRRLSTPQELSGLLNHGLCRLEGLRERGAFIATDTGAKAKERFRVDSDSVAGFIEDACERGADCRVAKARLYSAYKEWCIDSSRKPRGKQKFNRQVEASVSEVTVNGIRYWDGITLEEGL